MASLITGGLCSKWLQIAKQQLQRMRACSQFFGHLRMIAPEMDYLGRRGQSAMHVQRARVADDPRLAGSTQMIKSRKPRQSYREYGFGRRPNYLGDYANTMMREEHMILSTIVKLKALGLAKQVVLGTFINVALIGATAVAATAIAKRPQSGNGGLCCRTGRSDAE